MTTRKWHKGPPPHIGWWNASLMNDPKSWRWWNGKHWSDNCFPSEDENTAALQAANRSVWSDTEIEWTNYYPKNARVPRIDPTKGEVK